MARGLIPAAAIAAAMLGGCAGGKPTVSDGWVRLAASPGAPAAAYFMLHGGGGDDTLTGISTDMAAEAELHQSMQMGHDHGMTAMMPLPRVDLPAGGTVSFAPGGRHVMLIGVNPGVKPGGDLIMTLTFRHGRPLTERMKVVGPGDPSPY